MNKPQKSSVLKKTAAILMVLCMMTGMIPTGHPNRAFAENPGQPAVMSVAEADDSRMSETETPDAEDGTPDAEDETPDAEDGTPDAEDETPDAEDETPDAEDETPDAEDETPGAEDETPDAGDETPDAEDETPDVEVETPAAEDEMPAVEDETPDVEDETPDAEDETPAVEDETPAAEDETPAAEDETPDVEDETPAVEDETPDVEDEIPAAEDETPAVEDETPSAGNEAPAVEEEIPAIEEETPAAADETEPAATETPAAEEEPAENASDAPVGLCILETEDQAAGETETEDAGSPERRTLETRVGDYMISVSGAIPEGTEIQAVEIPRETAEEMAGLNLLFAYDIRLVVDGQTWQPKNGEDVQVSVLDMNGGFSGKNVNILHMKTDLLDPDGQLSEEALDKAVADIENGSAETETFRTQTSEDSTVQFDATSFSPYFVNMIPILQDMVDHAMAAMETLSGKVQVVLSRDVKYEGDVTLSAGNRDVADDFELELTAEDAGEDGMQGDGYTSIFGDLLIRGIKVSLNSILMAADTKITVTNAGPDAKPEDVNRGGTLVFNGTLNAVNALTVDVGKNSSAIINLPATSDTVNLTAESGAKEVTINAGDGVNTVNASVSGGDITITGGSGVDTFSVTTDGNAGKVIMDTGSNTDALTLVDNGAQGTIEVNAGADDDIVTIDVRSEAADVDVNTGSGTDILNLIKGDHHTVENLDYSQVYNKTEKINDAATAVVTVTNGDAVAMDRATVDTVTADAIKGIVFNGGAGVSVYLKGTLAKPADGSNPIRYKDGDPNTIVLTNDTNGEHKNTLEITGNANTNYTDALKNKKQVFLYASGDSYTFAGATDSFTDYVFKTPVSGLQNITITGSDTPLVLSNVVLGSDDSRDADDNITVNNLSAANLNVLLKGKVIDINGSVTAQNVRAESVHGTETLFQTINAAIGLDNGDQSVDLFNVSDQSVININAGADIQAAQDIQLLSRVKHFGGLSTALATIPGADMALNSINIKMADAFVNIRDGAKLTAGGSVTADAKIETVSGYHLQYQEGGGSTGDESDAMPLAVTVVVNDAAVNVENGAVITAGNNILMNADSQVKVKTLASSVNVSSPLDIALSIISNKATVTAGGSLTAGNEILLNANGSVTDETKASENYGDLPIGGFVAVNVVDQDVRAIVGKGANIQAGGGLNFYATAAADVQTGAVASKAADGEDGMTPAVAFKGLFTSIIKAIKDSWKDYRAEGPDEAEKKRLEKLDKLLDKVAGSSYSVKLIGYSEENDEKGTATVSTKISTSGNEAGGEETTSKVVGYVEVQPQAGMTVSEVRFRYLTPNENHYTYGTATLDSNASTAEKLVYVFDLPESDAEVYVIYASESSRTAPVKSAGEDADTEYEDVYDLSALFEDATGAAQDGATKEYLVETAEGTRYKLTFGSQSTDGKVLTWRTSTESGQEGTSLSEIHAGEKLRFVGNPAQEGEKLVSLTFSWTTEKEGVQVTDSSTVTADDAGRFWFTAPDGLPEDTEITVSAEFGSEAASQSVRTWQATGSIAAGVVLNDARALIESGTNVKAAMITGISTKQTSNTTLADASAVESGSGKKAEKKTETQLTKMEYSVSGAWYAVQVNSTREGAVTGTMTEEGSSALHPKFTINKDDAPQIQKILLSYYTTLNASLANGRRITEEIDPSTLPTDADGNLIYQPELNEYPVVYGSTLEVSFVFTEDGQTIDSGTTGSQSYVVRNPISLRWNSLYVTDGEGSGTEKPMGTLTFSSHPDTEPDNYYFYVTPSTGYRINSKQQGSTLSNTDALSVSWCGTDGTAQTASLHWVSDDPVTGGQLWYLQLNDPNAAIPEGVPVTINALFTEDTRKVTAKEEDHGKIAFDRDEAKANDQITATLTADDGYYAGGVELTYIDKQGTSQTKTISGVDENNELTFDMPELHEGAQLFVRPLLEEKTVALSVSGATKDGSSVPVSSVALSEKGKGYDHETITVSPADDLAKQGYKVSEIIYTPDGGTGVTVEGNSFDIPDGSSSVSLLVNMTLKDYELTGSTDPDNLGSIEPEFARADKNEKVFVNIVPKDGYRIKADTLKARISGGSGSFQIVLKREGENRYSFTVPGENLDAGTKIEVTGEFEKGSDALAVSAGVAVAVSVVQGNNENAIQGGKILSEGDISLSALTSGTKAVTEAKAGFNQGKTGIAGAVAVQVASVKTRAATEADAEGSLTIHNGALMQEATSIGKAEFTVNADASGKKKSSAENTGVGAGIAVGVDALITEAEAEDGLIIGKGTKLTGISITAGQKIQDTVTARAGAAGGSAAVVPAAAVDVFEGRALGKLGRLDGVNGPLDVTDKVRVTASSSSARDAYNHTVSADGSAMGGSVALAGAFAVSWLDNRAEAILNQSVNAGSVIVNAKATDALKETATAAASGGDKGKKDAKGGSADKQANSLMDGAANLAGKNGMNGTQIKQDTANRQKAETAEGSVAGAGALALNIMGNKSLAEIADSVNVAAKELISVISGNRTDATIKADGSTVKSDVGIGVAASVNIVNMENIARIGSGIMTAGQIEVKAVIPEAPPAIRPRNVAENADNFKTQLGETLKDSITAWLGDDYDWAAELVGDDFIATFADSLVQDLGLEKLFNIPVDSFADTFAKVIEKLQNYPATMIEPYRQLIAEIVDTTEDFDEDTVERILEDVATEACDQLTTEALDIIKDTVLDSAKDMASVFLVTVSDGLGGKGWDAGYIKEQFKATIVSKIREKFMDQMVTELVSKLGAEIPVINQHNAEVLKALKEKTAEELNETFVNSLTGTFRQQIYDYEILVTKIKENGIAKFLGDSLKNAAKKAATAVTNAVIEKVIGKLNVKFSPEPVSDRHIITTQSIAGAGATDVGIAGSVSIAVANLNTQAMIAVGNGNISVKNDGGLTISAEELRRIRTHATAAVDSNGEADNHLGAGEAEDAEGGAEAGPTETNDGISVSTDGRGTAAFDIDGDDPEDIMVRLVPDDGYTLKEGTELVRNYSYDDDGEEIADTVTIHKDDDGYYIKPLEGIKDAKERYDKLKAHVQAEFEKMNQKEAPEEDYGSDGTSIGVGAAFAMSYGSSSVLSGIGVRNSVTAGTIDVTAVLSHEEENYSTAGKDPLAGSKSKNGSAGVKDFSLDASVSVSMMDNTVIAAIAKGTKVTTTKKPSEEPEEAGSGDEEIRREPVTDGAVIVTAYETGTGETKASAFAAGDKTSVGASVAVNLSASQIVARLGSGATAAGKAAVWADSHSEDNTWSFASAMGGDIQRALDKVAGGIEATEETANSLARGEYFGNTDLSDDGQEITDTGRKITDRMNDRKDGKGDDAQANFSVSTNALRTQNAQQDSGKEAGDTSKGAEDSISENTDMELTGSAKPAETRKLQVAAAVGVTVSDHRASVTVEGPMSAGQGVTLNALNTINYNTRSTGAAMTLATGNSIAAAVGVSVNKGQATVDISGNVEANGNVDITATLTQNMDDPYTGKLGVQSLSGAVAGKDSTLAIAGAVSVLSTEAVTRAVVDSAEKITGERVKISADDKSKNAVRAGGISVSKGATVGMGLSAATILSENTVEARVGDGAVITATDFELSALKRKVTFDDYKFPLGWEDLVSDSSSLTDEQRENVYTGLIDVHKKPGETAYTVDVNLDTYALMKVADMLNFLSSDNYYAEAIAGSVSTGSATLSGAGSAAIVRSRNTVNASLGKNVTIRQSGWGGTNILADGSTSARMIGGAASLGSAKLGLGLTVTYLDHEDTVTVQTGEGLDAEAEEYIQQALADTTAQTFNAAASVNTGEAALTAGGAVNVLLLKNSAVNNLGENNQVNAKGSLAVTSGAEMSLLNVSVGVAGAGKGVAAGGTVAYIRDEAASETNLGNNHILTAKDHATISANTVDRMISILASASAVPGSGGAAAAGAINVLDSAASGIVNMNGDKGSITAESGNLTVLGEARSKAVNVTAAAAGGGNAAIGASGNVNVFSRTSRVDIGGTNRTFTAGNNLKINAIGEDTSIFGGLAVAGSGTAAFSGNLMVLAESNSVQARVAEAAQFTAGNAAQIESFLDETMIAGGGSIAISGGALGVGETIIIAVQNNDVRTKLGKSSVQASGTEDVATLSGEKAKGVYIGANARETQFLAAAGISAAGDASLNGVVNVLINNNHIIADASESAIGRANASSSFITVKAADDTKQTLIAGGVNAGGVAGVGAAVVTLVSNKDVKALAHDLAATNDISVTAGNADDITMLAISAGVGGTAAVQIGAAVQVLSTNVLAEVGSDVRSDRGKFSIASSNTTNLTNVAATVAAAGVGAFTPVGVVTLFEGDSRANLKAGSTVSAAKGVSITAAGDKYIDQYAVGAAASGTAAVSGTANVLISRDKVRAAAEKGSSIQSASGGMDIGATGDYHLTSTSAAIGLSGVASVAVNAVVSILKSNVTAEMAGTASLAGDLNVQSAGARDVENCAANVAIAGAVGVGVNVLVLTAGTKMSQDAADMLTYGNGDSRNGDKTFDASGLLTVSGIAQKRTEYERDENGDFVPDEGGKRKRAETANFDASGISDDLSGNGHRESEQSVGRTTGTGNDAQGTFDAASGYRSADFDDADYDDQGETQRGENMTFSDTDDIANAKKLNTYTYTDKDQPEDAVIARITKDAIVEKANNVTVSAAQPVTADLTGVGVSGALIVGAGVSASVAILRSNVLAESYGDIRDAAGAVTVKADSVSDGNVADRSDVLKQVLSDLNPETGGIRAVGAAMGAGIVGLAVGAGVVLTDNITAANLGGSVKAAGDVKVNASQDYGHVLAATGTLSGGIVAVGASVSVAQTEAILTAQINEGTTVNAGGDVAVKTQSSVSAEAVAATAGAGLVTVNAGVGIAINRMEQNTGIRAGSVINAQNINIRADSDTAADSKLLGINAGGDAVAMGAAVSQVNATLNTLVEKATLNATGDVRVTNRADSTADPVLWSISEGGGAAGGNVLLAFNETKSKSSVSGSSVKAGLLYVDAGLKGKASSDLASVQAGSSAIGIGINYADIQADNRAIVEDSEIDVSRLCVRTGVSDKNDTTAYARTISIQAGLITAGMNTAVARNNTKNYAVLTGNKSVKADSVTYVQSHSTSKADAEILGLDIGAGAIAASAVTAVNDSDSRVNVDLAALNSDKVTFEVNHDATTHVDMLTGAGGLIAASAGAGAAYGRSTALVDARMGTLKAKEANAVNNAASHTDTTITNATFGGIAAGVILGVAYSQDEFNTRLTLGDGSRINGDLKVTTDYDLSATADVTPSAGGLDVSGLDIKINLAAARNTAHAGADLKAEGGTVTAKNITVQTNGSGNTNAIIRPAEISVSGAKIGANFANSDLSMTQEAAINMEDDATLNANDVDVKSLASNASATASVGAAGADGISISLVNTDLSHAWARENTYSTAGILGTLKGKTTSPGGTLNTSNLNVLAGMKDDDTQSVVSATSNGAADVSFTTLGNLESKATSTDNFNAVLKGIAVNAAGDANISAKTNASSNAYGGAPGGYQVINGGISNTYGNVGQDGARQTAKVLLDEGVILAAVNVNLLAQNKTSVEAKLEEKGGYSLGQVDSSCQPTETWTETDVIIGKGAQLTAKNTMDIALKSEMDATSKVDSSSTGIILNVGTMKGENEIHEDNNLLIGQDVKLTSGGDMNLSAKTTAHMDARTNYSGSYSVYGDEEAEALNLYWRNQNINLEDGVSANAGGQMSIISDLGTDDTVETHAKETVRSFIERAESFAHATPTAHSAINLGAVNLTSTGDMKITAQIGGYYYTRGDVDADSDEGFTLNTAPTGTSRNDFAMESIVNIKGNDNKKAFLISTDGAIDIKAKQENLHAIATNQVIASGITGLADAYCKNILDNYVTIQVDNTTFNGKNGTNLIANFGDDYTTFIETLSSAALYAVGTEQATSCLKGNSYANILTNSINNVDGGPNFTHTADCTIHHHLETICFGPWYSDGSRRDWSDYSGSQECNFCDEFSSRYGSGRLTKALAPLLKIKGRKVLLSGAETEKDEIYVLDQDQLLKEDVILTEAQLKKYIMWTNTLTQQKVSLLQNATRLYQGQGLDYVAEIFQGDILGNGMTDNIVILTALNKDAFRNPVIPIGATGSLDFLTGMFTMPTDASFDLYLFEISGTWLTSRLKEGMIRILAADPEAINSYIQAHGETHQISAVPQGEILEGLTEDLTRDGWHRLWLGHTPETATDENEPLIFLLWNEASDEIRAYRTSVAEIMAEADPTEVSLYIWRDTGSDRAGEEKYNVMFYDTPAGEKSRVKVVTHVADGHQPEHQQALQIMLRSYTLGGADLPAYSLSGHCFIMSDGTDGKVSLFDGEYTASFDGDVFESDYLRIEGIREDHLVVTIKKNQPIWEEPDTDFVFTAEKQGQH